MWKHEDLPVDPDPRVEAYKSGLDLTLLVRNLSRTPQERLDNLMSWQRFAAEVRRAGANTRASQ